MEYYGGVFLDGGIVFLALKQFFHNKDGGVFFEGEHFTKRNIVLCTVHRLFELSINSSRYSFQIPYQPSLPTPGFLSFPRIPTLASLPCYECLNNMHAQNYLMFWSSCAFFQKIYLIGFAGNVSKERQYKGILFDIQWERFLEMGAGQL